MCGLAGGAGTSSLAFALARQAARESRAPVLLGESPSRLGGLAALAGRASPLSLEELASRVAAGERPSGALVEPEPGLRLLASAPARGRRSEAADSLSPLLRQARAAHGLVVLDCGRLAHAPAAALAEATHLIWTLPAARLAVERADLLLRSGALPPPGRAREALVAAAIQPRAGVRRRSLRRIAEPRCERLVLVPHAAALARGERSALQPALATALTALARFLRESERCVDLSEPAAPPPFLRRTEP